MQSEKEEGESGRLSGSRLGVNHRVRRARDRKRSHEQGNGVSRVDLCAKKKESERILRSIKKCLEKKTDSFVYVYTL